MLVSSRRRWSVGASLHVSCRELTASPMSVRKALKCAQLPVPNWEWKQPLNAWLNSLLDTPFLSLFLSLSQPFRWLAVVYYSYILEKKSSLKMDRCTWKLKGHLIQTIFLRYNYIRWQYILKTAQGFLIFRCQRPPNVIIPFRVIPILKCKRHILYSPNFYRSQQIRGLVYEVCICSELIWEIICAV